MEFVKEQEFREIFAFAVAAKAAKRLDEDMRRFYEEMDQQKQLQHKAADKEEEEREAREKMATTEQIDAFKQGLDDYDTKSVDALIANGEALGKIGKKIFQMRKDAQLSKLSRRTPTKNAFSFRTISRGVSKFVCPFCAASTRWRPGAPFERVCWHCEADKLTCATFRMLGLAWEKYHGCDALDWQKP